MGPSSQTLISGYSGFYSGLHVENISAESDLDSGCCQPRVKSNVLEAVLFWNLLSDKIVVVYN